MTTPVYPEELLPGVSTHEWNPNKQVAITDGEGQPLAYRRRTRDLGAVAQVTFRYLEGDFAIFQEFWKTELLRGHKWFVLTLPSAAGFALHTVRFIEHRVAKRDGYGYRTITAKLEVLERRLRALDIDTYLTTTPYPYILVEGIDSTPDIVSGTLKALIYSISEAFDIDTDILSTSTLRVALHVYTAPEESLDIDSDILDTSTLRVVLHVYTVPVESLDIDSDILATSTLRVALVSTTIPTESLDIDSTIVSGTLA